MRLILTRHGETIENQQRRLQGHNQGTLSPEGLEQARKVALRLKDEKIDAIYSSDLRRSAETAAIIGKYHPHVNIIFTKDLRERYLGEFQGKTQEELGWNKELFFGATVVQPKDGETWQEMYTRATDVVEMLLQKHPRETVLIVGHGAINRSLIAVITGKRYDQILETDKLHNTSITIYEIREDRQATMVLFNCIKHLSAETIGAGGQGRTP